MSRSVDERIVEMRFDNQQFERGVQTTMGTLDKLKHALKLDGITSGFEKLGSAAKGVDLNPLSGAVGAVGSKFSALEVMAITALANITNSAVNAGKELVKSLSIDQVKAGWQEYELKMNSVKTIMASTGEDIKTVDKYLEELNHYADDTIYSFSDMTASIGKFTNAGVKLDDAVAAIKGISNEAAISGANSNEASRAMYNFAQALAVGSVKVQDWKSIELANMATADFKKQLVQTAVAMGTLVETEEGYESTTTNLQGKTKTLNKDATDLRESLDAQWLSSEVLIQTLSNYSHDVEKMSATEKAAYEEKLRGIGYTEEQIKSIEKLGTSANRAATIVDTFTKLMDATKEAIGSGWAQTFEIIFGNLEEAQELWTNVSKIINDDFLAAMSNSRNEMLKGWKELGGRTALIKAVRNAFDGLLTVLKPISEAFRNIFPATTSEQLYKFTTKLRDFTAKLKLSKDASENLKNTFQGVFSIFKIFGTVISGVAKAISNYKDNIKSAAGGILEFTGNVGNKITEFSNNLKSDDIANFIINIVEKLKNLAGEVKEFFTGVNETITNVYESITGKRSFADTLEGIKNRVKAFVDTIRGLFSKKINGPQIDGSGVDNVGGIVGKFQELTNGIKKAVNKLKETLSFAEGPVQKAKTVFSELFDWIKESASDTRITDAFNTGLFAGLTTAIIIFVKKFSDGYKKISGLIDDFKKTGDDAGKSGIFGNNGIFGNVADNLRKTLDTATKSLKALQAEIKANILIKIAVAVGILAAALVTLAAIDPNKLTGALLSITVLFAELAATMKILDSTLSGPGGLASFSKVGGAMITMSVAVLILASALKKLSTIETEKLSGSILAISILLGELLVVALSFSELNVRLNSSVVALIGFAAALVILTKAVENLSEIEYSKMMQGLLGVTVLIAELAGVMMLSNISNFKMTEGLALIELAAAILILQKAVEAFGKMESDALIKGLLGSAAALTELAGAAMVFSQIKGTTGAAIKIAALSVALITLGKAVKGFAEMKNDDIIRGLLGIAGALGILMGAMALMPDQKKILGLGLGLALVNFAIQLMAESLVKMAGLSWEQLGKGLAGLAGGLTVLAIATNAMKGAMAGAASIAVVSVALLALVPVMQSLGSMKLSEIGIALVALAGAFTVLGVAAAVLGPLAPGLIAIAAALGLIGVAALAFGAGVALIATGLMTLSVALATGAVTIVKGLEIIFIGILRTIKNSAVEIGEALKVIVHASIDAVVDCIPEIVDGVFRLILEVIKRLSSRSMEITGYVVDFLIKIIEMLSEKIPDLVRVAFKFIGNLIKAIIDEVNKIDVNSLVEGIKSIGFIASFLAALAGFALLVPLAMAGVLGFGVVVTELTLVLAAVGQLSRIPGLTWFVDKGGDILQSVGTAIGKFIGGFVGGALEGISARLPNIATDLSEFMVKITPFLTGAMMIKPEMLDGVNTLAKTIILLTAANILDGLTKWLTGGTSLTKFGEELAEFGPLFKRYADSVSGIDPSTVTASANAALALAQMADTLPNSGGFAAKVFGDNSLAQFGKELEEFGPYISSYAGSVSGVKPESVQASVEAAQMLADMANTLPNSGGMSSKIFGDNTLSQFGEELSKFGPYISSYAGSVSGVKPESVQASVEAAQMLADMANTLPNQGGVVSWFIGDNTLSVFGQELEEFGPHIAAYSNSVTGVQPDVVTASANAAKALAELANNLPNTGGITSWFTGDNDISKFGKSVEKFGASFANYYNYISGVSPEILNSTTAALGALMDLAERAGGLEDGALSKFAKDLEDMGKKGVDGFVSAFSNAASKVKQGIQTMINTAKSALKSQSNTLSSAGKNAGMVTVEGMISGINFKQPLLLSTIKNLCTQIIQTFKTGLPESTFNQIGQTIINGIINGMNNRKQALLNTISNICAAVVNKFKEGLRSDQFIEIGKGVVRAIIRGMEEARGEMDEAVARVYAALIEAFKSGFNPAAFEAIGAAAANSIKNGIVSKINEIAKAAISAAKKAVSEAQAAFGGSSSGGGSKKSESSSGSATVSSYVNEVKSAGAEMQASAVKTAQTVAAVLSSEIAAGIVQPVVTPVLDLSNVYEASGEIQNGLNAGVSMKLAASVDNYKAVNTLSNLTSSLEKIESDGNRNIVGAIQELRTDVTALNDNMSRLQVVLDSGTLVGAIAPDIDVQLGTMAKLKSRGI